MNQEIADNSRACCNCANATMSYPNCSCWQHKYCNGDRPYVIPKEAWIKTAEECEEFEMGTCQETDVYLELHRIMSEESKDKNPKPMKYIDAEKLIAEIERKMKCWEGEGLPKGIDSPYCTLKGVRTFVESLQQEQPEEARYNTLTGQYGEILETHAMWECIAAVGAKLSKDGNMYCFLLGDNIQEGVCGFGKTIFEAALDFYTNIKTEEARKEE